MKSIILAILISSLSFAQSDDERQLYDKGQSYLEALNSDDKLYLPTNEDREITKSLKSIEKYCIDKAYSTFKTLVENYQGSENHVIYAYHLAELSNNVTERIYYYQKVIEASSKWKYYTIESKKNLAFIYFEEGDADRACKFLEELPSVVERRFQCGVERERYESQLNILKEKCQKYLGKKK